MGGSTVICTQLHGQYVTDGWPMFSHPCVSCSLFVSSDWSTSPHCSSSALIFYHLFPTICWNPPNYKSVGFPLSRIRKSRFLSNFPIILNVDPRGTNENRSTFYGQLYKLLGQLANGQEKLDQLRNGQVKLDQVFRLVFVFSRVLC